MKLSSWLNIWIEAQTFLKPTTRRVYMSHIENQIIPNIGRVPLKKQTAELLQNFVNNLEVSPATAKTIFSILKSALSSAEDKGYITNIWSKVKLPKKESSNVRILSRGEQLSLIHIYIITSGSFPKIRAISSINKSCPTVKINIRKP